MSATCPFCTKTFFRSSARPFCSVRCSTAKAQSDERHRKYALSEQAWRLAWGRALPTDEAHDFVARYERGAIVALSDEQISSELIQIFSTLRAHPSCKDRFVSTGSATYRDNPISGYTIGPHACEVCGDTLLCNGIPRPHKLVELSAAEAGMRGVTHFGNCYHVYACTACDYVRAVDSSG